MAERKRTSDRGNRRRCQRGALARSNSQGASKRETSDSKDAVESRTGPAGRYSSAIMTKEELRRIIAAFAECCAGLASYPTRCNIVERAKDGMYALHIMIGVRQRKQLRYNSLSGLIPGEKLSTLCEFCGSELRHFSGKDDGTFFTEKNSNEDIS